MSYKECPKCRDWFVQDQPWKKVCLNCYIQNKKDSEQTYRPPPPPPRSKRSVDDELLTRLIMLCHPDKHGNSKMSIEVTQKLLGMK